MKINKILIANRGEIALRIMRTAHDLNIKTVAIYSDADRYAPYVRYATEAAYVGASPSAESYLDGAKIIAICKKMGVDAVHPGYGFLSENADFAEFAEQNGIIFIGPSPDSINTMGNKLAAKKAVLSYNIPLVPGTDKAVSDFDIAKKHAISIGFPILIKAAAGGGGKGMRVVNSEDLLEEQMQLAINEAKSAFGNGSVFIERYIRSPRHIEIQIMADGHGNTVHLFERECSIQRRHQKVVEEAPSTILTPELRQKMGNAACDVAKACNYKGAGTVEFLLDANNNFYFLEMNTRLQVEHPVTELITGIDLVKEQISVAEGKPLSFAQKDISIHGHAIEVRVYAEDPFNNFLPDIGKLTSYSPPKGPGVRVDDGYVALMEIPIYYDPMIAKLISYGKTREEATARMIRAINDYDITGIKTTLPFAKFVMEHNSFTSGGYNTHFVNDYFTPESISTAGNEHEIAALITAKLSVSKNTPKQKSNITGTKQNNWKQKRT